MNFIYRNMLRTNVNAVLVVLLQQNGGGGADGRVRVTTARGHGLRFCGGRSAKHGARQGCVVTGAALALALALLVLPPSALDLDLWHCRWFGMRGSALSLATFMGPFEPSFATVMGPPDCQ